jgi:dipeptidyl aminopeptidase/acylaminoacyl peptidase
MSHAPSLLSRIVAVSLVCTTTAGSLHAQQAPPSTDVFLAPLMVRGDRLEVGQPVNITHRTGYDNQPAFTPDGRSVLYTSVREDGQSDIYRYDVARQTTTRLTSTPESEYSATVMPGGRRFSVVRVERDSAQRLWSFDLNGGDPRLVLEGIKPVGYHAWIDSGTLALFVLGSPNSLQIADVAGGVGRVVANDIGRSLVSAPGGRAFSYVQRADSAWWLYRAAVRPDGQLTPQRLARLPAGADFIAWTKSGDAITGQGTKLLRLHPGPVAQWQELADLSAAGLDRISRLTISADGRWLAFVAEPRASTP